jgi:hypothetical protein
MLFLYVKPSSFSALHDEQWVGEKRGVGKCSRRVSENHGKCETLYCGEKEHHSVPRLCPSDRTSIKLKVLV